MTTYTPHQERELQAAAAAILRGYTDEAALRELLILTTSQTTSERVEQYLTPHLGDSRLIEALVAIAVEGEDAGDAPWAAANLLAAAPADVLRSHEAALVELSGHPWIYLSVPAQKALAKLRS
jgi:hypothetical protein